MTIITDEYMRQMQEKSKEYCVCILKTTPRRAQTGMKRFVTEHNRRNFVLRVQGPLSILLQVSDGSTLNGVCIFDMSAEDVKKFLDEDPAIKEGIFTYELHVARGFPGDALPR